jgi:hypothetical protein
MLDQPGELDWITAPLRAHPAVLLYRNHDFGFLKLVPLIE